jgi:catechol 2,3-dioxygenase-like lactoylglutathione lyase family enzyme
MRDDGHRIARFDAVTIDCLDPDRLVAFWASVLGAVERWRGGDPVQYVDLGGTDGSPVLRFQRVPEPKTVKDRIHLDLRVDDIEEACRRVIELGGVRAEQGDVREYAVEFRVMLDPEGNEFCLVSDA